MIENIIIYCNVYGKQMLFSPDDQSKVTNVNQNKQTFERQKIINIMSASHITQ